MTIGSTQYDTSGRLTNPATLAEKMVVIFDMLQDLDRDDEIERVVHKWPAAIEIGLREWDIGEAKVLLVDVGRMHFKPVLVGPF